MNVMLSVSISLYWLLYLPIIHGQNGNKCVNGTYQTLGVPEGKPQVGTVTFSPGNVYVDGTVFIQCDVKANPKAEISWSFKYVREDVKRSFGFSDCNKTIQLRGAVNWHTGLYKCLAKNKYGQSSSPETPLVVKIKDQSHYKNEAVVKKDKSCLNLGENVTLTCENKTSKGICSWYKNNRSIHVKPEFGERMCSLFIHNVTKEDEGVYQCFMYYDLLKGELTLNVNKTDCSEVANGIPGGKRNNSKALRCTVKHLIVYLLVVYMFSH